MTKTFIDRGISKVYSPQTSFETRNLVSLQLTWSIVSFSAELQINAKYKFKRIQVKRVYLDEMALAQLHTNAALLKWQDTKQVKDAYLHKHFVQKKAL